MKDWRQEAKGTTEDEIVGCHHWLDGHEFEHASGVSDGQGSLACSSPRGGKELDTTEWLNWTESMRAKNVTPTPAAHFLSPSWHLAPSILLTWRDELLGCASGWVLLVTHLQAWTLPNFYLYSFLVWPHGALHISCDLHANSTFLLVACTCGYRGKRDNRVELSSAPLLCLHPASHLILALLSDKG